MIYRKQIQQAIISWILKTMIDNSNSLHTHILPSCVWCYLYIHVGYVGQTDHKEALIINIADKLQQLYYERQLQKIKEIIWNVLLLYYCKTK